MTNLEMLKLKCEMLGYRVEMYLWPTGKDRELECNMFVMDQRLHQVVNGAGQFEEDVATAVLLKLERHLWLQNQPTLKKS